MNELSNRSKRLWLAISTMAAVILAFAVSGWVLYGQVDAVLHQIPK